LVLIAIVQFVPGFGTSGCGLITRRVCVFCPAKIARTIGAENMIGRSRVSGFMFFLQLVSAVGLPIFSVVAFWLIAFFGHFFDVFF
jgi:hypothetical protein